MARKMRPKRSKPGASTWEQLRNQDAGSSLKNRDVHHNQNLERARVEDPITKTSRTVVAVIIAVVVAIIMWVVLSMLQWGVTAFIAANSSSVSNSGISSSAPGSSSADDWLVDTCTVTGASSTPCWTPLEDPSDNYSSEVARMSAAERSELPTTREEAAEIYDEPQWWIDQQAAEAKADADEDAGEKETSAAGDARDRLTEGFLHYLGSIGAYGWKIWVTLLVTGGLYSVVYRVLMLNRQKQNLLRDQTDINPYEGDQHIAPPMEVATKYNVFPDVGATSSVEVSSLLSHMMLSKRGLPQVDVAERHTETTYDEDGEPEYFAGEIKYTEVPVFHEEDVLDDDGQIVAKKGDPVLSSQPVFDESGQPVFDELGQQVMEMQPTFRSEPITKRMPIIDEEFGEELFKASGVPDAKGADGNPLRKFFDASTIPYNPDGSDREKLGKYDTVKDVIIDDWEFPIWEKQRPGGMYIVDSAPVNTMVLAITRAGKGQTYIESVIDMWTRERNPSNMVINDPKGELLVKNFVRASVRGYEIVQFNLINSPKTDIYNPLAMAAESARENDATKCAMYVENIAEVFFPTGEGDDPMWSNAANNAFKRAVYGLIDFYIEEERELRQRAVETKMNAKVLDRRLDQMWGKVTLYNCYQLFVQMSSRKRPNPDVKLEEKLEISNKKKMEGELVDKEAGEFDTQEEYLKARAESGYEMWNGEQERDELSLFFAATEKLPKNTMRELVMNADNALKTMAGAEKMLASVYGIAITAMSFFTDPTISTLTSGTPNQNVDLGGLSFPRRIGVRFSPNFCKKYSIIGLQARWSAYSDDMFSQDLGEDFRHEDVVSREGWAQYYFKGKFPDRVAYLKLELRNSGTGSLVRRLFFRFSKNNQTTLDGTKYVQDPISGEMIVRNGVLTEYVVTRTRKDERGRNIVAEFGPGSMMFKKDRLVDAATDNPRVVSGEVPVVMATKVRYSEKPKAVFLVTPPHLMKYAKLILILMKQLVDLNFDQSYMAKPNQKPLYRTRFMLDELGNLQSEGNGISGFATMLSIGLGQEQQFTLILQTLQQLRDVYGESVDKIVQGNAQPLSAGIATPNGWTTMGESAVGDEILVPAGGTARIDGVYPKGVRPVFEVTRADGSSTEACDEHLWDVEIEWPQGWSDEDIAAASCLLEGNGDGSFDPSVVDEAERNRQEEFLLGLSRASA